MPKATIELSDYHALIREMGRLQGVNDAMKAITETLALALNNRPVEICNTCGYFPCVNRKQFEGTVITHCTQHYRPPCL